MYVASSQSCQASAVNGISQTVDEARADDSTRSSVRGDIAYPVLVPGYLKPSFVHPPMSPTITSSFRPGCDFRT